CLDAAAHMRVFQPDGPVDIGYAPADVRALTENDRAVDQVQIAGDSGTALQSGRAVDGLERLRRGVLVHGDASVHGPGMLDHRVGAELDGSVDEIGRASCRERV